MRKLEHSWYKYLNNALQTLSTGDSLSYSIMTPKNIPEAPGIYLISVESDSGEIPYYIGRSKNLRNRIYRNHLMGQFSNARLKKYLVGSGEVSNIKEAKRFIRNNCKVRWFIEQDTRKRGAVEGYVTGMLFPKYGIYEEH